MINTAETSSQPATNVHCLPQCLTKWMWFYRQFFKAHNLARWSAANNNCVIASILLLSKAKSTVISLEWKKKMCQVIVVVVFVPIQSVPTQNTAFQKRFVNKLDVRCVFLGALCLCAQILQSDDWLVLFQTTISAFLYCLYQYIYVWWERKEGWDNIKSVLTCVVNNLIVSW